MKDKSDSDSIRGRQRRDYEYQGKLAEVAQKRYDELRRKSGYGPENPYK